MAEEKKILIVDDDHEMANALRRVLINQKKYIVDTVYDGLAVEPKYAEFKPDLILLDLRMPGMDGFEVCERLRKDPSAKDVKIMVVSGALDLDCVERFMKAGANDYITKPFRNESLAFKVERLLSTA
ncbi:MAG: response regulator [Candidatus Omnitrophica bacterium]|nr:response regulator [Candidatus Omnitrophota bacterium]